MGAESFESKMDADTAVDKAQSSTSIEQPDPRPEDTTTTKAELLERKYGEEVDIVVGERPAKRVRTDDVVTESSSAPLLRSKGIAPIKAE